MTWALALLNLWHRKRRGSTIVANVEDIDEAFKIWDEISESQEYNLPPYVYNLYLDVILRAWNEKNQERSEGFEEITGRLGLTRREITEKHLKVYGRVLEDWRLRQQIIPMLENAGLIIQEPDPNDKRRMQVYPTPPPYISGDKRNSESQGGVNQNNSE